MTTSSFLPSSLADLVSRTVSALRAARLPLDMPGSQALEETRRQLLTQLELRILPHIQTKDVPAIVVFGGSSGAGKSTLVNSLIRSEISPASVLRPTTRTPMIVVHPDDAELMADHALAHMGEICAVPSAIPGVVIVDAPDLDSVDESNRELSARLLDAADLWVFVTTAARYGDALAWRTLENAYHRGITCAVVLDRVDQSALQDVRNDLTRRIGELGLAEAPLFVVRDYGAHDGLLPEDAVADLRSWLDMIAATKMGASLVDRTTRSTLPALRQQLLQLADALEAQENALQDLKDKAVASSYAPLEKLQTNIAHGRFGQGAPTASWLSSTSTGGALAEMVSRKRPRVWDRRRGLRDSALTATFDVLFAATRVALTQALVTAYHQAHEAWENDIVDTAKLLESVEQRIDIDANVDKAVLAWKQDLTKIAQRAGDQAWISPAGVAALVGCAAGGISGAVSMSQSLGLESAVEQARQALLDRVEEALSAVTGIFVAVASDVNVTDSAELRLRASEFIAHA